eukprot:CAMPEP_0116137872 /NCGR_PEP_ID=MMETSP0329-20121206/12473_1 /TAXON_ID=697910 /ORGANISM="Pseudo-nitzschia arenysensis, Strain B593" /LENGTH=272 /DNA_ID=CAMNT_0003632803 /DNA_START=499 /DNA_END=1317 /DNA_ORIENTATION=+
MRKEKATNDLPLISENPSVLDKASKPTSEIFSDFAATKTPLLAELLEQETETTLPSKEVPWKEQSSEWVVVGLATFALVEILGDLLSNYEWVQTLRYFWPLSLGIYFGTLWNQANDTDEALRQKILEEFGPAAAFSPKDDQDWKSLFLQLGYVFGGFGLFVGGLADALLPVWMTGPNWVTNAGLAPDSAVLLLALSVADEYTLFGKKENQDDTKLLGSSAASTTSTTKTVTNATTATSLLLKIAIWAELYKLGEGSLDEISTNFQTIISSST